MRGMTRTPTTSFPARRGFGRSGERRSRAPTTRARTLSSAMLATTSRFLTAAPGDGAEWLRDVHAGASRYGERFALPKLTHAFAFERLS